MLVGTSDSFRSALLASGGTCPNCGNTVSFGSAAALREKYGINDNVVICGSCGRVYEVEIPSPGKLDLIRDVTDRYPDIKPAESAAPSDPTSEGKKSFRENWSKIPRYLKITTVLGILISAAVIILAALSLFDVIPDAGDIFVPLLGVLMVNQTIQSWKINRKSAYVSLAAAVIIFIVCVVRFFIR